MVNKEVFLRRHPGVYYLDALDLEGISAYLHGQGWLNESEKLRSARLAGEGNMNCALRIFTSERTFILKQARPWVEKYSHISAPWDRTLVEGRFYQIVSTHAALSQKMPKLLGLDAESRILALEDLGDAKDFTSLYRGDSIAYSHLDELAAYLSELHRAFIDSVFKEAFSNQAMRELNHQHIFDIPLRKDSILNLDSITAGLDCAAQKLKRDKRYIGIAAELGMLYLKGKDSLLHGDFFPGSWLKTERGARIIDPEFCFYGPPEFDLGVMAGHLYLANQKPRIIERLFEIYEPPPSFNKKLALQFAGIEIMRRLIGVAQLPTDYSLEAKAELLKLSHDLVLS